MSPQTHSECCTLEASERCDGAGKTVRLGAWYNHNIRTVHAPCPLPPRYVSIRNLLAMQSRTHFVVQAFEGALFSVVCSQNRSAQ